MVPVCSRLLAKTVVDLGRGCRIFQALYQVFVNALAHAAIEIACERSPQLRGLARDGSGLGRLQVAEFQLNNPLKDPLAVVARGGSTTATKHGQECDSGKSCFHSDLAHR